MIWSIFLIVLIKWDINYKLKINKYNLPRNLQTKIPSQIEKFRIILRLKIIDKL